MADAQREMGKVIARAWSDDAFKVIPLKPSSELSDEDLEKVAGGRDKCILLLCNER